MPAERRVSLRPLTVDDVGEAYLGWMRDPQVLEFLEARFQEHTLDSLREFVHSQSERDDVALLAIVLVADGRHIGNLKIGPIDPHHRTADLGILIGDRSAWGQGFGSEAIALAADHGFGALGLRKLTAGAYEANAASVGAFRKAGWVVEGRRARQYISTDGAEQDQILFAAFADSWSRSG